MKVYEVQKAISNYLEKREGGKQRGGPAKPPVERLKRAGVFTESTVVHFNYKGKKICHIMCSKLKTSPNVSEVTCEHCHTKLKKL